VPENPNKSKHADAPLAGALDFSIARDWLGGVIIRRD
jgi:hypothetical protein